LVNHSAVFLGKAGAVQPHQCMSLCVKTPLFLLPWETEYYWSVNSSDVRLQACICCFSERLCHSGPLPVKAQATTKPSLAARSHSS